MKHTMRLKSALPQEAQETNRALATRQSRRKGNRPLALFSLGTLILLFLALSAASWAQFGQPIAPSPTPTSATLAANPTSATLAANPTSATLTAEKKEDDGLIIFNLKDAKIDLIAQFISEHTGKPVMRSKKVNATVTVSSPSKITPLAALDLIYEDLLMEGCAVLESETTIKLVPTTEITPQDLIIYSGPLPEDVSSQKSRLIRRVITLNSATASVIKAQLDPLLDKFANVTADDHTNKLIITDTVRNIERYERILEEFDTVGFAGLELKIVPLKYGEAPTIVEILRSFVLGTATSKAALKAAKASASSMRPGMPLSASAHGGPIGATSIMLLPLTRTNSIMIMAPREKFPSILELIDKLDLEKPKDVNMHIINILRADPDDVARTIMRIFPYSSRLSEKERVTVVASDYMGKFIVVASDEKFKIIEELVAELDGEKPVETEIRVVHVERGDPRDIADSLMSVLTGVRSYRGSSYSSSSSMKRTMIAPKDQIRIIPVEDQNTLIISASPENHERINELLKELDAEKVKEVDFHILPIERGDVHDIANAVENLFPSRYERYAAAKDRVRITPSITQHALIISASKENYAIILDLVKKLDAEKIKEVDVYVIDIEFADTMNITDAIKSLFPRERNMADKDVVDVIESDLDGTVVVSASKENYEKIKDLVAKLDTEKSQTRETRTYKLVYLDAEDTADELTELYGSMTQNNYYDPWSFGGYGRGRGRQDDKKVSFVPVVRTNSIMVVGPPSEFDLVEKLIKDIDIPMDKDDILPKIYHITNADAQAVEKVLNTTFGNASSSSSFSRNNPFSSNWRQNTQTSSNAGRLAGKINFSADENTNSIIVTTTNKFNFEIVDEVIATLDRPMPELANTLIVSLEHANATELATELNTLFGKPVQPKANDQNNQNNRNPFFGNWGNTNSNNNERPISNLIDRVRVVPDTRTNSLMITAASYHFAIIEEMVHELDCAEPQVLVTVRIVEVTKNKDKKIGTRWNPDSVSGEDLESALNVINDLQLGDSFGDFDTREEGKGGIKNGIIDSSVNMNLLMQIFEKTLDSDIRSKTGIYISNNKTGKIVAGKNIFRSKGRVTTPQGGITEEKAETEVGITLEVTPKINDSGNVMMSVSLIASQQLEGDTLQNREYNTEVAINSDETAVLGGVELENEEIVVHKVPILGDIPLLGFFFKKTGKVAEKTDLYVFITPTVVSKPEDAKEIADETEAIFENTDQEKETKSSTK